MCRYVKVDVYGGCGRMRCLRTEFSRCRKLLNDDYKFYLSFENSNCDHYITEKFYENGLRLDAVLIIRRLNEEAGYLSWRRALLLVA